MTTPIKTLTIVCCHAIYFPSASPSTPPDQNPNPDNSWLLEPFQKSESQTFAAHITEGIRRFRLSRPHGILAFSGGATKKSRLLEMGLDGGRTEAGSYLDFARDRGLFGGLDGDVDGNADIERGVVLEEWATDSFQNVLLCLIRFGGWWEAVSGRNVDVSSKRFDGDVGSCEVKLPEKLIIVSHEFKRARFLELHLPAIASLLPPSLQSQYRSMEVEFIGIDPPFSEEKMAEIREGDRKRGYGAWKTDLYGVGELLSGKRKERGWNEDAFLESLGSGFGKETREGLRRILSGMKWKCWVVQSER